MGTNRKKKREMVKGKWIYILGRDKFKGRGGYNVKSQNVYDKEGNLIGRLDRNYRVNGKVVPDHVHLKTDNGNIHHWLNN